jgi:hypothetical protein
MKGSLVYIRTYSGSLEAKQVLYNSTRGVKERLNQLLLGIHIHIYTYIYVYKYVCILICTSNTFVCIIMYVSI